MKRFAATVLSAFMFLALAGCGESGGASYEKLAQPDYSGSRAQLHIGAWVAPPPGYIEQKYYDLAAESGITTLYALTDFAPAYVDEVLACCEKAGIRYYARDSRILGIADMDEEEIAEKFAYTSSPAFAGHLVSDEPSLSAIAGMGDACDAYKKAFPDALFYVNLFPSIASIGNLGTGSYTEYVSTYLAYIKTGVLSYDSYPLYQDGWGKSSLEESYLSNMQTIAVLGSNAGVDYWSFVQCCSFSPSTRRPSRVSDITFQYYTYLAYGFKGLQEFCFWTPGNGVETFTDSMIDREGNPTDVYYFVKEANAEVQALAPVYLNYEWQGTMTVLGSNNTKNSLFNQVNSATLEETLGVATPKSHERIRSVVSDEDALVGTFKDGEYDGFLVTNFSDPGLETPKSATVTITFNRATKALVVDKGVSSVVELNGGAYTATIGSGEAQFIVPFD